MACRGNANPNMWFPEPERGNSKSDENRLYQLQAVEALEICAECPIRKACLDKAFTSIDTVAYGIWGGTLAYERLNAIGRVGRDTKMKTKYQTEIRRLADKRGVARHDIGKRSERLIWKEDFYHDELSA